VAAAGVCAKRAWPLGHSVGPLVRVWFATLTAAPARGTFASPHAGKGPCSVETDLAALGVVHLRVVHLGVVHLGVVHLGVCCLPVRRFSRS
jgi:hypothetical protein